MKAAVTVSFGEPLVLEDLELAAPGPGQVEVELTAVAICHSDIHAGDGAWGGPLPVVNGHEAAGVVTKLGDGVGAVAEGDVVAVTLVRTCGECFFCRRDESHLCRAGFALGRETPLQRWDGTVVGQGIGVGGFAEKVVVHASQVARLPSDIDPAAACLLSCGVITGYGAVVNTASVEAGAAVAVIGTGGVGLNSVQGAVAVGAAPIIAVDVAAEKLEAAKRFGAHVGVTPAGGDTRAEVRSLTDGRGVDYAFVTVGSVAAIEQGFELLRPGGTLVVVGMTPVGGFAKFEMSGFAFGGYSVLGSRMGSTVVARDIPLLVDRYQRGELFLDELITGRFPLEEINAAIDEVRRGLALRNVIVFDSTSS